MKLGRIFRKTVVKISLKIGLYRLKLRLFRFKSKKTVQKNILPTCFFSKNSKREYKN